MIDSVTRSNLTCWLADACREARAYPKRDKLAEFFEESIYESDLIKTNPVISFAWGYTLGIAQTLGITLEAAINTYVDEDWDDDPYGIREEL